MAHFIYKLRKKKCTCSHVEFNKCIIMPQLVVCEPNRHLIKYTCSYSEGCAILSQSDANQSVRFRILKENEIQIQISISRGLRNRGFDEIAVKLAFDSRLGSNFQRLMKGNDSLSV